MNKRRIVLFATLFFGTSLTVLLAAHLLAVNERPSLAAMLPDGALLYLESPDFHSLISDWNQSPEKQAWLKSDNYDVFSRSRLFGRLSAAQTEFAAAAGLPPDMQLIAEVAGKQSAFAWYDIGKLEFVYLTRMPSGAFDQSRLWQARSKFEHREAAGSDFYLRTDPQSGRTVAFAAVDDWVILGTGRDLVADTLTLVKGAKTHALSDEPWYAEAVAQAKSPGDLRMVLNLQKLVPSPYFRSYWVQQNITGMKQYRAAVSDLYRDKALYREERVLLRSAGVSSPSASADISSLAAAAPSDAGFYQAIGAPDSTHALSILQEKLLDPKPALALNNRNAPNPELTEQNAGQTTDLETRIDQAPADAVAANASPADAWAPLRTALDAAHISGLLEVESSAAQADSIFRGFHSAVVISAEHDWPIDALEASLSSGLQSQLTTSRLGVNWSHKDSYLECDGLLPLFVSAQGKYIVLANDRNLLLALRAKLNDLPAAHDPAVYVAEFNHAAESGSFSSISGLIDRANQRGASAGESKLDAEGESPAFFSGNIASLSQTFSAMTSEKITVRDAGEKVTQTVTYEWK
jgi:hypothetical protein